jgi:LPXTG-motif cell wall-anchored protein
VLFALDPKSDAVLGPLEARLGVHFDRSSILDDKNYVAARGPRWAITNQFSSHASITSLSKAASNEGVLLLDSGSLDDRDFGGDPAAEKPKRTYVIRSMQQSFRDLDGNGGFTEGTEKRDRHNIAAAIEGPTLAGAAEGEEGAAGFRAMVFADLDLFVDRPVQQGGQIFLETWGGQMPSDAIKWVGGEEIFSGDITTENDVEITQSKRQDSWWFLLTIIGGPAIVLGAGLLTTRRRKRPTTKKETTP